MPGRKVLLVEGKDDLHVFKALFGQRNLAHLDEIKEHEGYVGLLEAIPTRIKESDVEALGIVLDADADLSARWASVRERLERGGYHQVPNAPSRNGVVVEPPNGTLLPRIGVWLMPNNHLPGILEDFVRCLVPVGDPLLRHAQGAVAAIPSVHRRFPPQDLPKATIHTWLAWQAEPGKPLGLAITAGFLRHECPEVDSLVQWLQSLYFP